MAASAGEQELDKQLERYILQQYSWETLPLELKKSMAHSRETWKQHVIRYSIRHQLRWKQHLVQSFVPNERQYYEGLLRFCRLHYLLYPYQLSDVLIKGLRVTPFKYYLDMMSDLMLAEKSYDSLPNFTAADGVRLLGIGRNQYIALMNKLKASVSQRNFFLTTKANLVREFLPKEPMSTIPLQHWWLLHLGVVGEEDIKSSSKVEHAVIDLLLDEGPKPLGVLPKSAVQSLYSRGLVWIEVPVHNGDLIRLDLKDFVMNRVGGDYFENLLYTLFVSLDERTPVEQVAKVLDLDLHLVKTAVSIYLRLGLATKKNVEPLVAETTSNEIGRSVRGVWHSSWISKDKDTSTDDSPSKKNSSPLGLDSSSQSVEGEVGSPSPAISSSSSHSAKSSSSGNSSVGSSHSNQNPPSSQQSLSSVPATALMSSAGNNKRIGFLFDSTLAAFMMMGNLAEGLKAFAVTMFEVGKIAEEQMDAFLSELSKVSLSSTGEGEAERFFQHAITLRNALRFLRHNASFKIPGWDGGVELIRCERLNSVAPDAQLRLLNRSYALLISMAPIASESTITAAIPLHFGPIVPEVNSPWFKLFLYHESKTGPPSVLYPKGARVTQLPSALLRCTTVTLKAWDRELVKVDVCYLLPTLNEMLLSAPVLVQAFSYTLGGADPQMLDVLLPLEHSLVPFCDRERDYTSANLHTHPSLTAMAKVANLTRVCGFVKMLFLDDPAAPMDQRWVPLQVHYGLPLFSLAVTEATCAKIEQNRLFSGTAFMIEVSETSIGAEFCTLEKNLQSVAKANRRLALQLLDFIAAHIDYHSEVTEYGAIALPTRAVSWPADLLQPFDTNSSSSVIFPTAGKAKSVVL